MLTKKNGGSMKKFFLILFLTTFIFAQKPDYTVFSWARTSYQMQGDVSTFQLQDARIGVKGKFAGGVKYMFHYDAIKGKTLNMFFDYSFFGIGLRAGQFKYPFGIEALPSKMGWDFSNPSQMTKGLHFKLGTNGGGFRDIGVQATKMFKLNADYKLGANIAVLNGNGILKEDNNKNKSLIGRLFVKSEMIYAGGSYYMGDDTDAEIAEGSKNVEESGFNLFGQFNAMNEKLKIQAEYSSISLGDAEKSGFYAYGLYKFTKAFAAGYRFDSFIAKKDTDATIQHSVTLHYYVGKKNRISFDFYTKDVDGFKNIYLLQFQTAL
jgi:hypothetical protein